MQVRKRPAEGLRVVVADANHLDRRGLADILRDGGAEVVAQAPTMDAALRSVVESTPDALVVSMDLPRTDRGHVVAIARDRWPHLAVVALSERPSDEALFAALRLGASAYLPKTVEPERFVTAVVQAVSAPGAFVADDLSSAGRRRARGRGPRLTPRESEVLVLAAEGLTVRQMSARLYVSEATTRSHLAGVYRKLAVTSRSQAVLAASRLGMLPPA